VNFEGELDPAAVELVEDRRPERDDLVEALSTISSVVAGNEYQAFQMGEP